MSNEILQKVNELTANGRVDVPVWTPRPAATRFTDINDIEGMRTAGRLASEVLTMLEQYVVPGVSTEQLDIIAHNYIVAEQGAIPAPLNYHGFPKSCCTSVNGRHLSWHSERQTSKKKVMLSTSILPLSKMATMAIPVRCFLQGQSHHMQNAYVK